LAWNQLNYSQIGLKSRQFKPNPIEIKPNQAKLAWNQLNYYQIGLKSRQIKPNPIEIKPNQANYYQIGLN